MDIDAEESPSISMTSKTPEINQYSNNEMSKNTANGGGIVKQEMGKRIISTQKYFRVRLNLSRFH